ncbi:suppressor of IKBKE 1-like [Pristis pectinata]|uniref:suppressor of IKBKE 1-like n=1 Tax=Pristis pectinata TaxID=685728 RepID=UPI00223E6FA6|nr:suppressor of IKBKE 1-like [Pristis pectinata]XP_051890639.1 suppressor of IKBKE 1-like [Pristis pectinata]XP_051890640.1 suppressor of IKBKE 1-like [Pristis pectinata]XP_051890641.1 suppressor of IKBKE 1-like [Pristis pectinata]
MACTIEKVLADAKALVERLKDHHNAAESLIEQTTTLNKRVEGMKEVGTGISDRNQEDFAKLKKLTSYKPYALLSQENTQIRDLQHENKELWLSLEEHRYALELIMSKYRKQMLRLLATKKPDSTPITNLYQEHSQELQTHVEQICGMASVMRKAIQMDDPEYCQIQEKIAQLELENKELRELVSFSKEISLQENVVQPLHCGK